MLYTSFVLSLTNPIFVHLGVSSLFKHVTGEWGMLDLHPLYGSFPGIKWNQVETI